MMHSDSVGIVHLLNSSFKVFLKHSIKLSTKERSFNKIAIQAKGPDGKWTRKPLAYQK